MKSTALWLTLFLIFETSLAFSQVSVQGSQQAENLGRDVYGLGVSAGPASGIGISFRNHLPSKLSYQIVGGIIRWGGSTSASIGAELQYDLVREKSTRLFFGPSTSYLYNGSGGNTFAAPFRLGIGIGGEVNLEEAVNLSLEGVFVYFSNGDIAPMPQIACHYYFY
ncbi:MAG: hypothetical protein WBZ48_06115 [Bacteroidota bacterium]